VTPLEHAKQSLPLPDLLSRIGLGSHAKTSAKCPFHEDKRNSFSVFPTSKGGWGWKCHSGCGGGDEIDLIAKFYDLDKAEACRRFISIAGTQSISTSAPRYIPPVIETPDILLPAPIEVSDAWKEGLEHIQALPTAAKELEDERGWSESQAQYLIDCGVIGLPMYFGSRGYAFPVAAPLGSREAMVSLPLGFHIRKKDQAGNKQWFYAPSKNANGRGIPSLPFFVGDFSDARLLVILEGIWDAFTFGLAARWIGPEPECLWPKGAGLIAIRGVEGYRPFLKHYRPYWPTDVNCLVIADSDGAGSKWHTGADCFAEQLKKLCRKVCVVNCAPHKDFNDAYRQGNIGPGQITELLMSHGISLENEVMA
jgi:hypothetical protein